MQITVLIIRSLLQHLHSEIRFEHTVFKQNQHLSQWRSEAKLPPGADHKSAALSTSQIYFQNFKWNFMFRAYSKI